MTYLKSIYIHWEWASHLYWKAKSFSNNFWTIAIPRSIYPEEAVEYYKNNLSELRDIILIWSSAWAISIQMILKLFSKNIRKIILFNPAIYLSNLESEVPIVVYVWKEDWWVSSYNSLSAPQNVELIEIDWDHSFTWKEELLNSIISHELSKIAS